MNLPVRNLRVFVANVAGMRRLPITRERVKKNSRRARSGGARHTFVLAFSTPPFTGYGAVQDMARASIARWESLPAEDRPVAWFLCRTSVSGRRHAIGEMEHAVCRRVNLSSSTLSTSAKWSRVKVSWPVVIKSLAFGV